VIPSSFVRSRLDAAVAAGILVALVTLALVLPPRPFGDSVEYLLMAESWAAHGSPALRAGDVDALRGRVAASGLGLRVDDALGNYFEGRDGRFYCYHFSFYPLLTMPARMALAAVGADALKAGPLTGAVLFAVAIGSVLLLAPAPPWPRRAAAALLLSSPALGFLLWPHPEVLAVSMATLALVLGARGLAGVATVCAALASVQSPPLALLAVFEAARPWLSGRPHAWSGRRRTALVLSAVIVLASPLFFLALFRTPNLAAYETAGVHAMGLRKSLDLLFDLDLGLVRYAPLTVGLCLSVAVLVVRRRSFRVEGVLLVVLAAMMGLSSATGNWNHGTTGPSRYAVWLFPVVTYLVALGPTAQSVLAWPRRGYPLALALAVAAQVAVAAARRGPLSPLDYLDHSRVARLALDRWPALYAPVEEVFRERTAHTEADLDEPIVYSSDGRCRKALARWKHADALVARCGPLPLSVRPFFESRPPREDKGRWVYVDY
jgi:hypothetical protein